MLKQQLVCKAFHLLAVYSLPKVLFQMNTLYKFNYLLFAMSQSFSMRLHNGTYSNYYLDFPFLITVPRHNNLNKTILKYIFLTSPKNIYY